MMAFHREAIIFKNFVNNMARCAPEGLEKSHCLALAGTDSELGGMVEFPEASQSSGYHESLEKLHVVQKRGCTSLQHSTLPLPFYLPDSILSDANYKLQSTSIPAVVGSLRHEKVLGIALVRRLVVPVLTHPLRLVVVHVRVVVGPPP